MVNLKILDVNMVTRVVSVAYTEKEIVNNIHLTGPEAGRIDMDDQDVLLAYLKEYGETYYGGPPSEPHPLIGVTA